MDNDHKFGTKSHKVEIKSLESILFIFYVHCSRNCNHIP